MFTPRIAILKLFENIFSYQTGRKTKLLLKNIFESLTYYSIVGHGKYEGRPNNVVFVCRGNICRSPFAAAKLEKMLGEQKIKVASYGLDVRQSRPCPCEAIESARKFGVEVSEHVSKGIDADKIGEADLIILMEYAHYRDFVKLFPKMRRRSKLLREFAPFPTCAFCNISDPYGYEIEEYRKCFSLIEKSLNSFVEKMVD